MMAAIALGPMFRRSMFRRSMFRRSRLTVLLFGSKLSPVLQPISRGAAMDRRQLLFGMSALGLAGSLNLNELVSAQGRHISDQGPKVRMYPPDVELNEPRGPVKMCREETTM